MIPALRAVCGEQHQYVTSMFRYLPSSRPARTMRALALKGTHRVFAGTEAARERLISDGCRRIVLSCSPGAVPSPRESRADSERRHGTRIRLLWSGFLQQIGRRICSKASTLAQRVRQRRPDVHFTFSLKPECLFGGIQGLRGAGHRGPIGWPFVSRHLSPLTRFSPRCLRQKHSCTSADMARGAWQPVFPSSRRRTRVSTKSSSTGRPASWRRLRRARDETARDGLNGRLRR